MKIHRINLKGPWGFEWLTDEKSTQALPANGLSATTGKLQMPMSWQTAFGSQTGTVQLTRRFHTPTNLASSEQVHLVFDGVVGCGDVLLNGALLGQLSTSSVVNSFDITALLQPANLLAVNWTCDANCDFSQPAGLYAPVALEIQDDSRLAQTE